MQATATTKYAEALAHDIAAALRPHHPGRIAVRHDNNADTWAVRITVGRTRYDMYMPAAGALYTLFRNNRWLGGLNTSTDATPTDVARAVLHRINTH